MQEKQENIVASGFRTIGADHSLYFDVRVTGDTPILNYCGNCPINNACFGEKGQKSGKARVNLDSPIVKNLTSEKSEKIPCGAGIEVIDR